jgi:hypothetical protein
VSKTEFSYTYTQTPKEGQPYNLYHGTLEASPLTATNSKLVYTLFFDNSMLPDDAARAADRARRAERFTQALQNMKISSPKAASYRRPRPQAGRRRAVPPRDSSITVLPGSDVRARLVASGLHRVASRCHALQC